MRKQPTPKPEGLIKPDPPPAPPRRVCDSDDHGFPGRVCPVCREVVLCALGQHRYIAGVCLNCQKKERELKPIRSTRTKDLTMDYLSVTRSADGFVQVSARLLVRGEPAEVTIRRFGRLMENVALGRRRGRGRRAP